MGLFDKKFCDVCGGAIGLLGNRKLVDGNLCKNCAALLSPFNTDRRKSTLAEIKDHLAYRQANKAAVAAFRATRTLGGKTKVVIDDNTGKFLVTASKRWENENPDIIDISQVLGVETKTKEDKTELKLRDSEGNLISFDPPRYDIDYDFYLEIDIRSPWFDKIEFKVNDTKVNQQNPIEYMECQKVIDSIKEALMPKAVNSSQ